MRKTGSTVLPLHGGYAPAWLIKRMRKLSDEIVFIITEEYGSKEFIRKLSDPYWFQAFGCVLGFDWHSSGLTTVVTRILKDVLSIEKHGMVVAGGKGKASRRVQIELEELGNSIGLSESKIEQLRYASRMSAKVDTAAIQAGYPIYHHSIFVLETSDWAVIQQGINVNEKKARRSHWLSESIEDFIVEPHDSIVGEPHDSVLNMTSMDVEECRRTSVDIAKGDTNNLISSIRKIGSESEVLDTWIEGTSFSKRYHSYEMPTNLNWKIFKSIYDVQPRNYEELLALKGIGPATIRALALVSQLIYGKEACWDDPVKFSYAIGGKDGVPYPVDKKAMDEAISFLREITSSIDVEYNEKKNALNSLGRLSKTWGL